MIQCGVGDTFGRRAVAREQRQHCISLIDGQGFVRDNSRVEGHTVGFFCPTELLAMIRSFLVDTGKSIPLCSYR